MILKMKGFFCSDIERVFCSDIDRGFFCSDIERGDFNRKRVGRVSINIGKRGRLPTKRKTATCKLCGKEFFERGKCKKQVSEQNRTYVSS